MKIKITFDLADYQLEAINHWFGRAGKATREDAENYIDAIVTSTLEVIVSEHQDDTSED